MRLYLLNSNEDLRAYFIDSNDQEDYIFKTKTTEIVAGVECNIWENRDTRICRYQDLIALKKEKLSRDNEWKTIEQVSSVKFNEPLNEKLFILPLYEEKISGSFPSDEEIKKVFENEYQTKQDMKMYVDIIKKNHK